MLERFFYWLVQRYVTEGCELPRWLVAVRWVLLPIDTMFWRMERQRGYQFERDTWMIGGVRYTGAALRMLAAAQGETYRITRMGEVVTLERVHNA